MQIHITRGEDSSGPFSLEEVQNYLAEGILLPDDMAWHEGLEEWVSLAQLVAASAAPVTPHPTTSPPQPAVPAVPAVPAAYTTVEKEESSQTKATQKPKSKPNLKNSPRLATFPVVIMDNEGHEVIFTKAPERIVAFDSAAVETIFAIGEGDRVVATHDYVSYPPKVNSIKKVGDAFNMDIETIVNLDPDLVYIFYPTFKEQLKNAGLKVLLIPTIDDDFQKTADLFRMWGSITGAVKEANILASDFEMRVDAIQDMLSPYKSGPTVFQDVGGLWTPGNDTLIGNVFKTLKLQNVAHDVQGYTQFSPEMLIERNPQYIIASHGDSISSDNKFKNLTAVRNGAVITPDDDYLSTSGPRFILGVEELAKTIYPGLWKR